MRVIRIIELVNGDPSPFDGQYLKEYDPTRPGVDPNGEAMTAHVITTPNRDEALQFQDADEAMECWKRTSGRTRMDGKLDRPLTAFTVEVS